MKSIVFEKNKKRRTKPKVMRQVVPKKKKRTRNQSRERKRRCENRNEKTKVKTARRVAQENVVAYSQILSTFNTWMISLEFGAHPEDA